MADKERVNALMAKLREEAALSAEEVTELQSHVDALESDVIRAETHHESHFSPNTHHTQHHTSVTDFMGFLERVVTPRSSQAPGGGG